MTRFSSPPPSLVRPLILASGSAYRAELLRRLHLPFVQTTSAVDETARDGEMPADLAKRLALAKAGAVAAMHQDRWVLGSDQVCACNGHLVGKPGDQASAIEQLEWLSGREALFLTAVALIERPTALEHLDTTIVRFRTLEMAEILRYVEAEPAFDCAGSFKSEGLGISLCEAIESTDPTALIGLPLMATRKLLASAGYAIP